MSSLRRSRSSIDVSRRYCDQIYLGNISQQLSPNPALSSSPQDRPETPNVASLAGIIACPTGASGPSSKLPELVSQSSYIMHLQCADPYKIPTNGEEITTISMIETPESPSRISEVTTPQQSTNIAVLSPSVAESHGHPQAVNNAPISLEGDAVGSPVGASDTTELELMAASPAQIIEWRYADPYKIPLEGDKITTISSFEILVERSLSEYGWEARHHPEGKLYFVHAERGVYTHANIYDTEVREKIDMLYDKVYRFLPREYQGRIGIMHIVIDIHEEDDVEKAFYYLAYPSERRIFWPQEVCVDLYVKDDVIPVYNRSHLRYAELTRYWQHVEMFPNYYPLDQHDIDSLLEETCYAIIDGMTSDTATSPLPLETLSEAWSMINKISAGKSSGPLVSSFARLSGYFAWEKFLNFHGQRGARLSSDQTVFERCEDTGRSVLFRAISILLFFKSEHYMDQLNKIWVDQMVRKRVWDKFITTSLKDWKHALTPTTVLLGVNIGFLAIQSVDNSPGSPWRTFAQIASYSSILCCLANLLISSILIHRCHTRFHTMQQTANYLMDREQCLFGLESLAIEFSAPSVLFIWGMLLTTAAICYICLDKTNVFTLAPILAVFIIISIVVIALIYMDWRSSILAGDTSLYSLIAEIWSKFRKPGWYSWRKSWRMRKDWLKKFSRWRHGDPTSGVAPSNIGATA